MPYTQVSLSPYSGVIDHTSNSHNAAVEQYGVAINAHSHDPSDPSGNYGSSIPAYGPTNPLYSSHGPGGGATDWMTSYNGTAAIPASPAEMAIDPTTGRSIAQVSAPYPVAASDGIMIHLQRLYGAMARLKATSKVTGSVQASPSPTTGHVNVAVGTGATYKVGVPITVGAQSSTVSSISGDQISVTPAFGSVPTAGVTVTQTTGNWWDAVQMAQLGNTPQQGNMVLDAGYYASADRFVSNVATGTAPMTVASTTKVPSLNADMVDGFNAWQTATGASGGTLAPPTAPTANAPTAGGTLATGHSQKYALVYNTSTGGSTTLGAASVAQTPSGSNLQIPLTAIAAGPPNLSTIDIYRQTDGTGSYGLVGTVANGVTTWTDTGFVAGAAPPGTNTATYAALVPAFNNDGFLAPGYVEYDVAEAATWDTLTAGASSIVSSLNRIRHDLVALETAAGGGWGSPPVSLVTSLGVSGGTTYAGGVALNPGVNVTMSAAGGVITINANGQWPFAIKNANYAMTGSDRVIEIHSTGVTVTLPHPATVGAGMPAIIKNWNVATSSLKTDAAGVTIDGTDYSSAAFTLSGLYASLRLVSNGTNWSTW